ncbi:MAG: GNAT family N-acetyltransferase [Bacteroidia bacterium]|nr:GNAT family N-acetyltransferase [Bacteroidia bacterium]
MLTIKARPFKDLNTDDIYEILRLRSEVFVVEQNCVYQDIDNKDQKAIHVLGYKGKDLVAYARLFKPGYYFKAATIGRVVVKRNERANNYGRDIMIATIKAAEDYYKAAEITVSAQTYLIVFYNELGFIEHGDTYLEDGIPHIRMTRSNDP